MIHRGTVLHRYVSLASMRSNQLVDLHTIPLLVLRSRRAYGPVTNFANAAAKGFITHKLEVTPAEVTPGQPPRSQPLWTHLSVVGRPSILLPLYTTVVHPFARLHLVLLPPTTPGDWCKPTQMGQGCDANIAWAQETSGLPLILGQPTGTINKPLRRIPQ